MADRSKNQAVMDGPRALQAHEHDSAIELVNRVLRTDRPSNILDEYPLVLGKQNLQNMRVVVHEGRVVSHAAVYHSLLRTGDTIFRIGGISSVATAAPYRGQGLGSAVVKDCVKIIRQAGCELSVLWTQRRDFYRNLGFEPAGAECLFHFSILNIPAEGRSCTIVPYSASYLPEIMNIHEREPYRTERATHEYETYFSLPRTRTLLSLRDGEVTAYAVMGKGEDFRNCVHEWGGAAEDLLRLVRALAFEAESKEVLILAPAARNEFTEMLRSMRLPEISEPLAMMKIVDLERLAAKVQAYIAAKIEKRFDIFEEQKGFTLKLGSHSAHLAHEGMLVRLLFGPDPPTQALNHAPHAMARSLAKALPIPLFIWGLDSV